MKDMQLETHFIRFWDLEWQSYHPRPRPHLSVVHPLGRVSDEAPPGIAANTVDTLNTLPAGSLKFTGVHVL